MNKKIIAKNIIVGFGGQLIYKELWIGCQWIIEHHYSDIYIHGIT